MTNASPPARGKRAIKFTPQAIEKLKEFVAEGISRDEIANRLGVTVGSLQVTCSRLGISLRRRVPLRPINGQPQQNSQSGPMEQAQAAVPYQERVRTKGVGLVNLVLRMQYRGDGRTTELPLTQDMITQLAFEAEFRGMGIGELIGALIAATMEKDLLLQLILDAEKVKK
jgi:hypothetical protein